MFPDNCNGTSRMTKDDADNMYKRIDELQTDLLMSISISNSEAFNSALAETAARLKDLRKYF